MSEKEKIYALKSLASSMTLLYVEDNKGLSKQAAKFFEKFFKEVYTAEDGEEGLELFKKYNPKIVITDIKMPNMNGIEMSKNIRNINPKTKIIVTTAFNDPEYLLEAVNTHIYRYLQKPVSINELTTVLIEVLKELKDEEDKQLFDFYLQNIFHNQQNLLFMFKNNKPVIANKAFLSFFKVNDLEEFEKKYISLGDLFLEHKDFLYNKSESDWFSQAISNTDKLHHVKMFDLQQNFHHFILKIIPIENSNDHFLVSMDDITELGLLKLFDENQFTKDKTIEKKSTFLRLFESVQRNSAEVKMYNLYKGVTIVNKGLANVLDNGFIELRAPFLQLKAAKMEKQMILSCELFPSDILCKQIKKVDFDKQTILVDELMFIEKTPMNRDSIRLRTEDNHTVSFFYKEHKFGDGVKVVDISRDAVKLSLIALPSGIEEGEEVIVDIVFTVMKKHIIINSKGKVYSIQQGKKEYLIVILLEPTENVKKLLIDYLAKRQMALIREFKGLEYER